MRALLFIATLSITACASTARPIPSLENRTLYVSKGEIPGLYYQWRECTKRGLFGGCKEEKIVNEYYDFRDPAVRKQLNDMGFRAQSERRIKP